MLMGKHIIKCSQAKLASHRVASRCILHDKCQVQLLDLKVEPDSYLARPPKSLGVHSAELP